MTKMFSYTSLVAACYLAARGSAYVALLGPVQQTTRVQSLRLQQWQLQRPTFFASPRSSRCRTMMSAEDPQIVSPFDSSSSDNNGSGESSSSARVGTATAPEEFLDLTWENVEKVLDEMRHYLIQDGGNVIIADIDGPVVKLELQGACGTCPSSTQTMKMGLERGLKEKIPEIQEVIQSMPQGPALVQEQVDIVLDGVRPFLQVVGGNIDVDRLEGVDGLKPTIWLHMQGNSASLNSVKLEIAQRLQRHFMMSGLQIQWKE